MREKPPLMKRLAAAGGIAAAAMLAGCSHAVLNPAGDVARQQRDLIYVSTLLMLLIIVPVMVLTVVFAWRYRAKAKNPNYDPTFHHSTALELIIWSCPLLIIICLGALTWSSTHLLDPFRRLDRLQPGVLADRNLEPLRVQVVSLDWKWLFIYPEQGVATVNELALPTNREVRFEITSTNMMNTFYAPTMAGMIYAMPGMRSQLHAVVNRPGEFEGFSANYSGAGFSGMRFRLRSMEPGAFDQWVRQTQTVGVPLTAQVYQRLEEPSERHPVELFRAPPADLFDRIVNRCVQPGAPCLSDHMGHGGSAAPSGAPANSGERGPQGQAHDPAPSSHRAPVTGSTSHGG